jgi:hypothetical protein
MRHFQRKIDRTRGVRERADGNVIDSRGCDAFYIFQRDAAACFKPDIVFPQSDGLSHLGRGHVVEKDDIYAVNFGKSARLLQIIGLDLNPHVWSLPTKLLNSIGKTGKPSEGG